MRWPWIIFGLIALAMVLSLFLGGSRGTSLNVVGSTSIQPFAEMEAQEYQKAFPSCFVDVQGGGSTAGLQAAANGLADIGTCSRGLKKEEEGQFQPVVIARDGLAIVVHLSNPLENLTRQQVRAIFMGSVTHWKDVGGRDAPIRLITREEGSGTREAFAHLVMEKARIAATALTQESNGAVKELVRHDPCAIGYMSLGLVGKELKILKVDGVTPSADTVRDGSYTLARPFLFVTKGPPSPDAQAFIDYVRSPPGRKLLEQEGLIAQP